MDGQVDDNGELLKQWALRVGKKAFDKLRGGIGKSLMFEVFTQDGIEFPWIFHTQRVAPLSRCVCPTFEAIEHRGTASYRGLSFKIVARVRMLCAYDIQRSCFAVFVRESRDLSVWKKTGR